jgi:hypothetical protein
MSLVGKLGSTEAGKAVFSGSNGERHELIVEYAVLPDGRRKPTWKDETTGMEWQIKLGLLYRLRHMDPGLSALAALAFFLCASFAAIRWNHLLRANGVRTSLWETWRLYWVGTFFNNFVPGLTGGDLARAYFIAKRTGRKTVPVLTVMVDRIVGVAALALLALVVVLFNLDKLADLAWGVLTFVMGLGLLVVLFLSPSARLFMTRANRIERFARNGFLHRLLEAIEAYQSQKALLLFWLLASMLNHVLSTAVVALLGQAMGLHVSLSNYFVLVPVISIASAVPLTPSGWGVSEALSDLLFVKFAGLAVGDGAGLSVVSRIVGICWSLMGGILLVLMKDRAGAREIEREMQTGGAV